MKLDQEPISFKNLSKSEKYHELHLRWKGISEGEADLIANLSNAAGLLKEIFNWWWVGFYLVKESELVLGPFQGPVACTRIAHGQGVCGAAWKQGATILVQDVNTFPGHIACSAQSLSEIVIPIYNNNAVCAVLDADSEYLAHFDMMDQAELEIFCRALAACWTTET